MINFLNLIRWKNLALIAIAQILVKYALLDPNFGVQITLNEKGFALIVLATLCIAAAGYIINDIFDQETDAINKPNSVIVGKHISEKTANNLYIFLTVVGVSIGFYMSYLVGRPGLAALFVIVSALLYLYSSYLKHIVLVGNIVVSLMVALAILIVGIFELLPVITEQNQQTQSTFFSIIRDYAIFAFLINLVREMVKDLEDIDGDYNAEIKTLPIVIGRERAGKIVFGVSLIPIAAITFYVVTYLYKQPIAVGYFLLLIIGPLLYFAVKAFNADTKKEWQHLSVILKLVLFFGVLSMMLYKLLLLN